MDLIDLFGQSGKAELLHAPGLSDTSGAIGQATGSPILRAGQALLAGMRSTAGRGEPDQGEQFGRAASRFETAGRTLAGAQPGTDWMGAAARAYAAANQDLTGRTDSLAVLDNSVRQVISRQAHRIAGHRETLSRQSEFLTDVGVATRALSGVPGVGPAARASVEMAAVTSAVQLSEQDLRLLTDEVSENAARLEELAAQYGELGPPESPTEPDPEGVRGKDPSAPHQEEALFPSAPPVVGAARSPAAPADPFGAAAGDPAAGMTAALSAVGGMIGAVVAPLSAVLTGTVGAAVQSMSALAGTDSSPVDRNDVTPAASVADVTSDDAGRDATGRDEEPEPEPDASSEAGSATPPSLPAPPVDGTPGAAAPPAATRPPH